MLRRLHNHIFASRLQQVFTQSQLVLVYQTLGQVDHTAVRAQLVEAVAKQLPADEVAVDLCHMKNTVAAASGDDALSRLFNNSNLLLGFALPRCSGPSSQQQAQQVQQQQEQQVQQQPASGGQGAAAAAAAGQQQAAAPVTLAMAPQQVVGGLLERPQPGKHVPQPALRALVELGLSLPSSQPLVLVGAFYKASATPLAHLKQWIKLDEREVYGQLLGALESPLHELLAFERAPQQLLDAFDAAGGRDVADLLGYRAAAAAGDEAAPPSSSS